MATLKDIATKAGVSVMAVSAVMNATTSTRVSEKKRALIRKVAEEMGYQSNVIARTLRGGSSRMLGVIIDSQAPPWCYRMLRYIEEEAGRRGYRIMISAEHDCVDHIIQGYEKFLQYGVDGVISLASEYPGQTEQFNRFFSGKKNIVIAGSDTQCDVPRVFCDIAPAWHALLEHFQQGGRQRIGAVILDLPIWGQQMRIATYRQLCAALELPCHLFSADVRIAERHNAAVLKAEAERCVTTFVQKHRFDGLLVHGDLFGTYLWSALTAAGHRIPEDIAFAVDDHADYFAALLPPIACIDHRESDVGQTAVTVLLERLSGQSASPITRIPATFVARESAGLPTFATSL